MKTMKLICASILGAVALLGFAPGAAEAEAYRHYVACGINKKATPSHVCARGAKKGAFFKSKRRDVHYTVCLRLPRGRSICARRQLAEQGTLYVNTISTEVPGKHRITWFVRGERVGAFIFRVRG